MNISMMCGGYTGVAVMACRVVNPWPWRSCPPTGYHHKMRVSRKTLKLFMLIIECLWGLRANYRNHVIDTCITILGNAISAHPRRGMDCFNHHQYRGRPCADYMVRYYCPEMGTRCRRKRKEEKAQQLLKEDSQKNWNNINKDKNKYHLEKDSRLKSQNGGRKKYAWLMNEQNWLKCNRC